MVEPGGHEPLVTIENLRQHFPIGSGLFGVGKGRQVVHAVDGVDMKIAVGETMGLIGESGSGKSTLGRTLLRLYEPTSGHITFDGRDVTKIRGEAIRQLRREMQMVFQNPYSAVNRRMRLLDIITEPMRVHGIGDKQSRERRGTELLELVGLSGDYRSRFPHEVSGGQLQRVGIARALSTKPKFLVADEPTASLDVSVRAQIINLLADLKEQFDLTLLFISHDLSVVSYLSDRIAVMYLGRVVESGPKSMVERRPKHPYTTALLGAVPRTEPRARRNYTPPSGEIPSAVNPPTGCYYHPRCPLVMDICRVQYPPMEEKADGQFVACHAVPAASPVTAVASGTETASAAAITPTNSTLTIAEPQGKPAQSES